MSRPPRNPPASLWLVTRTEPQDVSSQPSEDHELDWSILMARAQDGDSVAYRRLLKGIAPYLRALAARRHREPSDQDDAVQDVLLCVHAIRHTYDPARPFGPWLTAIANRRMVDRLRRQGRRNRYETPLTELHGSVAADAPRLPTDHRALEAALAALPPGQRRAVRLLKLEELSLKEAEAVSGISMASLKVTVHRALKTLRSLMSDRSQP